MAPTRTSPLSVQATTEGVVRAPSSFTRTLTSPPSMIATTELVVPRSMPMTFLDPKIKNLRLSGGLKPNGSSSRAGNICTCSDRSAIQVDMIVDQIRQQVKEAMRAKRELERDILRTALGEI